MPDTKAWLTHLNTVQPVPDTSYLDNGNGLLTVNIFTFPGGITQGIAHGGVREVVPEFLFYGVQKYLLKPTRQEGRFSVNCRAVKINPPMIKSLEKRAIAK